jgi:hypothetical protein
MNESGNKYKWYCFHQQKRELTLKIDRRQNHVSYSRDWCGLGELRACFQNLVTCMVTILSGIYCSGRVPASTSLQG